MTGFVHLVNGFSQAAIDALVTQADDLYISGVVPPDDWVETPLPAVAFDVTDYGVVGNGTTNNNSAMTTLAGNTGVTNWYFPAGEYRMNDIVIPSHVVAVYGEGTIVSISTGGTGYELGGLSLNSAHQDFVLDGLSFEGESGYAGNQYYGQFQLSSAGAGNDTDNTQIRNCHFDASLRNSDSLRVFARTDASGSDHTNLRIYNNTFEHGRYFAIEAFNNTDGTAQADDMEGLRGLRIYNNLVTKNNNTAAWGIGIGRIRGESHIYNNDIDVNKFAIEIIQSVNCTASYNRAGADDGHALSQGVVDIGGNHFAVGVNYVHNNHFYGLKSDIYRGSRSDIYENYFNGFVELRGYPSDNDDMCGNFHDNTVISTNSRPIHLTDITSSEASYISNNEVYGETTYTDTWGINHTVAPVNVNVVDNDVYQVTSPNSCVQPGFTESGTTCTVPYSGSIPTSRAGAGLSDPGNVGRP